MQNSEPSILVIIPARAGSKGLPGKNVKLLCGQPLIAWPIETAKALKLDTTIMVSTDSQEIADISLQYGAEVPFLRPSPLANDQAKTVDVIMHSLDWYDEKGKEFDYIILLEPTSPLTETTDIESAFKDLQDNLNQADSIVGVVEHDSTHPEFSIEKIGRLIKPYNKKGFSDVKRRQEIDNIYFLDGSFYISTLQSIRNNQSFYHHRTMGFEMPKCKSFEIDDIVDFFCVESMIINKDIIRGNT